MIGSSPNAIKYHENPIAEDLAEERRNVIFTNTIIFCILVSIVFVIITVSILIVIIVILEVNYQEVEKNTQIVEDQSRYSHNFIRLNESNQTLFNDPIYSKFNQKNSSQKALVCNLGYSGPNCQDECGVTIFTPNLRIFNPLNRIVGGYEAWPHSWPSLAYIVFNFQVEVELPRSQPALRKRPLIVSVVRTLVCAGTLIGRKTIITAAHCIIKTIDYNFNSTTFKIPVIPNSHYPTIESMYRVYLGVHDKSTAMAASFNGSHDPWESEMKRVARISIHPDFDAVNKLNDLAVITLADEIEFSPRVQIACLPPPSLSMSTVAATAAAANRKNKMLMIDAALKKSEAWIVGWGSMYEGGPMVEWLRNARLEVFDGALCRDVVKEFKKNWTIQICAGDLSGKHDSCQGDSGGPLFSKIKINDQSRYYLSGIVSYGEGCGEPNKPGIYTRISAYIDWIQDNIEY